MDKNGIVNELIAKMKERIPDGQNLANYLTDTLCMGKEAVYRRLRGEVAFTFEETAQISRKLGISIDQIIGNHSSNRVTFDLNLYESPDPLENYYNITHRYMKIFEYVKSDPTTELYTASNILPFTLYAPYEYLSKFRLCRWIYQTGKMQTPNSLEEMELPERIVNTHKQLSENVKKCPKSFFIWDTNIFRSFVQEVKYFSGLNLLSSSDVLHLKRELHTLLNDMEYLSAKGEFNDGGKVFIYLSNISFEATYSYLTKKDYQVSLMRIYSINSMDSQSPHICEIQKNWIQSLKRHSTLISESGEAQRLTFLEQQRTIIERL